MAKTRTRLAELVSRRAVITMVVLTVLGSGAAFAESRQQSSFADDASSVATLVPGLADRGLVPIAVIDREDIERSGVRNLAELILNRASFNAFGPHRTFFLGSGAVMTMINGQRVSRALAIDGLNLFPVAAVERIEILGAGAGTNRGAHALAGAINIVTKRDFRGAEAQLFLDRPTAAGGDAEHAGVLWGGEVGKGHLTVGADVFRRREIRDADREYSRVRWQPRGSFADAEGVSVAGNTFFHEVDDEPRAGPFPRNHPDTHLAGPDPNEVPGHPRRLRQRARGGPQSLSAGQRSFAVSGNRRRSGTAARTAKPGYRDGSDARGGSAGCCDRSGKVGGQRHGLVKHEATTSRYPR